MHSVTFLRLRKICSYETSTWHTGLDMLHKETNSKSKVAFGWISEGHKIKTKDSDRSQAMAHLEEDPEADL